LPTNVTFGPNEEVPEFLVTLNTVGTQTITVTDTSDPSIDGTLVMDVTQPTHKK
jgi:hypothetical protein